MNDLNIIDQFLSAFSAYIDAGFGLVGGDVHSLTALLIGIDGTLAALFWALGGEQDVLGRFVRKILYVGAFAYILNNFATLGQVVFTSFSRIGLEAGGGGISAADLLKPGRLAGTGFAAAWPLLDQARQLCTVTILFNLLPIAVLLIAWLLVILAFFILAVQLFITILEFKLTSLAGFVLVPFALWNRTSFLAERVLGNIVSSGVKVMLLAIIVGIGSTFFGQLTSALQGQEPDIAAAMSLVLASLALLGLGIFGPSIASGLVSGAPQLGAGAAIGTTLGTTAALAAGGGAVIGGARALAGGGARAIEAIRAGSAMSHAAAAEGHPSPEPTSPSPTPGPATPGAGVAAASTSSPSPAGAEAGAVPAWARGLQARQAARHREQIAVQAVKEGDGGGASAAPDIHEKED